MAGLFESVHSFLLVLSFAFQCMFLGVMGYVVVMEVSLVCV
jgi:hypothetical protein